MLKNLEVNIHRLIVALLIGGYFINCIYNFSDWHFIDSVDLIIHEAGHMILRFGGEFIYILGGSLFQILIPLLFIIYFFRREDYFSSSIVLTWLGYNLVNVSTYINDAIVMQMELLGGDSVIHDWNYLLSNTSLLSHTHSIGNMVHSFGIVFIIISIVSSLWFSIDKPWKPSSM